MAIIKSDRDRNIRRENRIDTSLNARDYHELQKSSQGTTTKVNKLVKKYALNKTPIVIDTTIHRKF